MHCYVNDISIIRALAYLSIKSFENVINIGYINDIVGFLFANEPP